MPRRAVLFAALSTLFLPACGTAQVGGNLAAPPPLDLYLEITGRDAPTLSQADFELVTGEYYRFNVSSDGRHDWRFEAETLLENVHLRLVTIDGIEVHLQGLSFRAIELDQEGSAAFSFTPIRPGTYEFTVGEPPPASGAAREAPPPARGRFVVR